MNIDDAVRFLRLPELLHRSGLSRSTIYDRIRAGELRPVKLGARAVGFVASEVEAWLKSRIDARAGSSA